MGVFGEGVFQSEYPKGRQGKCRVKKVSGGPGQKKPFNPLKDSGINSKSRNLLKEKKKERKEVEAWGLKLRSQPRKKGRVSFFYADSRRGGDLGGTGQRTGEKKISKGSKMT